MGIRDGLLINGSVLEWACRDLLPGGVIAQTVESSRTLDLAGGLLIFALAVAVFVLAIKLVALKKAKMTNGGSQGRLEVLFNQAADAIYVANLGGRLIRVNAKACQVTGYSEQELLGMNVFDVDSFHATTSVQFVSFSRSLKPGQSVTVESLHRRKDETTFPVEITITRIQTAESDEIIGFARDISERRMLEQQREQAVSELRQQERFISAIADTSPALVYVYDMDDQVNVYSNAGIERLLGYTAREIQDMGDDMFDRLIHREDMAEVMAFQDRVMAAGDQDVLDIEYRMKHRDGRWCTLHSYERPFLRHADGTIKQKIGIAIDVTEPTQVAQALQRSQQKLVEAQHLARIGDFTWDIASSRVTWSDGMYNLLKYDKNESIDYEKVNSEIHHPDDLERVTQWLKDGIAGDGTSLPPNEYRLICKDGTVIDVLTNVRIERHDGKAVRVFGTCQDITGQRQADNALRSAKEYAENLIETANVIVVGLDNDGHINVFNQTAEEITGYTRAELQDRSWFEVLVPKDQYPHVWEEFERLMGGGVPQKFENPILTKSGEERYIVWQNSEVREFGKVTGIISFGLDITDRRLMEETLRDSQRRYQGFIQGALEGIWCNRVDPPMPTDISIEEQVQWIFDHMVFVECNDVFARMYGYDRADEVVGLTLVQLMGGDQQAAEEVVRLLIDNGYKFNITESLETTKNGESVWFLNSAVSFYDEGKVSEIWGTQLDITERKKAEAERELLIDELEDKNQEMERLIYTISHDMKSPLVTIGGYLGMLKEVAIAGDIQQIEQDVARIEGATGRMKELLDDLLQLSRIGRTDRPAQDVGLSELAEQAFELVAGHLPARGVEFIVGDSLPVLHGDRSRLLELVQNLVENAIKYMGDQQQPRVEIGARRNGGKTVCYVKDNGMGIDPQYQDKVFQLFEQLNPGVSEGTGVGLAIVRRIVETNNGKIWVESDGLGQGTTFCFELPVVG